MRYVNMFVIIGVVLMIVSIAGFLTGNLFLREPGYEVNTSASWIYMGAGVLMIINGIVSAHQTPRSDSSSQKK